MNTTLQPPAKFRQMRSKFGATPTKRRLNFSFNVYAVTFANAGTSTIQSVIAGALANWELVGGTAGVQVTRMAGLGFFHVTLSANVYTSFSNDEAARGLADDLRRNFLVSALTVSGTASTVTGGNIFSTPTPTANATGTYIVSAGDTLSKIAARFGTTWQALAALNGLTNPNALEVGQFLRVSGTPQVTQAAPSGSGTPLPNPTGTATPPPAPEPKGTLEGWAGKVGISVSALVIFGVVGVMIVSKGRN